MSLKQFTIITHLALATVLSSYSCCLSANSATAAYPNGNNPPNLPSNTLPNAPPSTPANTLPKVGEPQHLQQPLAPVSFAIIGDGPYGDKQEAGFDRLIQDINRDQTLDFVIHVGDIKSGGKPCTNQRLQRRFQQLQQIETALIYTPGDNEWTDCHRKSNGRWNPLERLDYIRSLFFANPTWTTGKKPFQVITQANYTGYETYVENSLFMLRGILFATIHVVGSSNNLEPWSGIDSRDSTKKPRIERLNEFNQRNAASLHWLDTLFTYAKDHQAKGIFIAIHADPKFELAMDDEERQGFNPFLLKLSELTSTYHGPVVLGHGDFHRHRLDKPLFSPQSHKNKLSRSNRHLVSNFTRVEVFGDDDSHWVKVTADPTKADIFHIRPKRVKSN